MKKMIKQVFMVMVLLLALSLSNGCSGEDAVQTTEPLDLAGTYTGTVTIGKTQIVYDSDGEEYSEPYAAEEDNSWEGTASEVTISIEQIDESTIKLIFPDGELSYEGEYDTSTNIFTYQYIDENFASLENILTLTFAEVEGVITAKGALVSTSSLPELSGLTNEVVFDLVKSE